MSERKHPTPKPEPKPASKPVAEPGGLTTHEVSVLPEHLRASRDRIYESMMRGGGEPFGRPFAQGLSSLTQAVLRKIKQKGFFAFETLELPDADGDVDAQGKGNKFTRYGAAPFRGDHADVRKRKP